MSQLLLFGKWGQEGIIVSDMGLAKYINLRPSSYPTSFGRRASQYLGKKEVNIVERLANKLMITGHLKDSRIHKRISGRDTGKKQTTYKAIASAFEQIEKKTGKNPLQVLVTAIENTSPREETTRIRQGGIIAHKAVDVSPLRRLDVALSFISHGAGQRAFQKKPSLASSLAEEIMAASRYDTKTYSVSKCEESERVAQSAR